MHQGRDGDLVVLSSEKDTLWRYVKSMGVDVSVLPERGGANGSLDEFTMYGLGDLAVVGRAAYEDRVLVLSDAVLREAGNQRAPTTTLIEPLADSTRADYPPADLDALCVLMRRTDTPDDGRTIGYCSVIDPQRSILLDLVVVPPPEAIDRFVNATGVPVIIQKIGADI